MPSRLLVGTAKDAVNFGAVLRRVDFLANLKGAFEVRDFAFRFERGELDQSVDFTDSVVVLKCDLEGLRDALRGVWVIVSEALQFGK
jgi:hypothetical protein